MAPSKRGRPISHTEDPILRARREAARNRRREFDARRRANATTQPPPTQAQLRQGERVIRFSVSDEDIEPTIPGLGIRLQGLTIGRDLVDAQAQRHATEVPDNTLHDDADDPIFDDTTTQPQQASQTVHTGSSSASRCSLPRQPSETAHAASASSASRHSLPRQPSETAHVASASSALRHSLPPSRASSSSDITRFFSRRIGQNPFDAPRSPSLPLPPPLSRPHQPHEYPQFLDEVDEDEYQDEDVDVDEDEDEDEDEDVDEDEDEDVDEDEDEDVDEDEDEVNEEDIIAAAAAAAVAAAADEAAAAAAAAAAADEAYGANVQT
ncbi:hypothetical protein LTR72_011291 [Exophiala xenobiotica]|nr:hypothetical protein LTR72_011291 [Exophiala xenobiotica]